MIPGTNPFGNNRKIVELAKIIFVEEKKIAKKLIKKLAIFQPDLLVRCSQ